MVMRGIVSQTTVRFGLHTEDIHTGGDEVHMVWVFLRPSLPVR